jgi:hypothetical protein
MATPPVNGGLNDNDRNELRLLYEVSVGDIAFFKQQQWNATNYALGLDAALIFIAYDLLHRSLSAAQGCWLITATWVLAITAIAVVLTLECSIRGRRTRLRNVRGTFGAPFWNAWRISKPPDLVVWLLVIVVLASAAIVTWLFCIATVA